jgi:hypothetical protein
MGGASKQIKSAQIVLPERLWHELTGPLGNDKKRSIPVLRKSLECKSRNAMTNQQVFCVISTPHRIVSESAKDFSMPICQPKADSERLGNAVLRG